MKDKVSIIAFFTMLIGFTLLLTSVAMSNENMGLVALLFILPSITINVAIRWINIGNLELFIKEKVSIVAFFTMILGFIVLVASIAMLNENMGMTALMLILPSMTLSITLRWFNIGSEEQIIKEK